MTVPTTDTAPPADLAHDGAQNFPDPADDAAADGPLDAAGIRRLRQEAGRRRVEARETAAEVERLREREARRDRADVLRLAHEVGFVDPEDAFTLKVLDAATLPRTDDGDLDVEAARQALDAVKATRPYLFEGWRQPTPGQGESREPVTVPEPSWNGLLKPSDR